MVDHPDLTPFQVLYLETLLEHVVDGLTRPVLPEEGLLEHESVRTQHVGAGIRHAVPLMVPGDVGVEDAEPLDHAAVDVGEQRVGDAVLSRELSEDVQEIIADGKWLDPVPGERLQVPLQLDELRLAEPSPEALRWNRIRALPGPLASDR